MYTTTNYQVKKQLVEDVKAGKHVTVFQPGGIFSGASQGWVAIEGPHYPQPHRWYARAFLRDGVIVKIK